MREFYEGRLKEMQDALTEKETEREKLLEELKSAKTRNVSKGLQEELRQKEAHIANLRKKQKELMDLTTVSSRNDSEITRLQNDVKEMKRRKVDLQKELREERKNHAKELKRLQKEALQKERELNKWKKVSNQREMEAERAAQMSKHRLEELGQMRNRYKDAEKKLRILSVKRGVMAKAGLDPVIVGRREPKKANGSGRTKKTGRMDTRTMVNVDALRDYFDEKVATVAKKEALVDKLAKEWEDHFELTLRRQEEVDNDEVSDEALQALAVQIQFKEDRIRQFAQRLGKQERPTETTSNSATDESDSFLFGKEFSKVCNGTIFYPIL
jgi:hypothetical protein